MVMSKSNIFQRLQTEAAQQPAKAAVLVAGLLVGVYLWFPKSLFSGGNKAVEAESVVATVPTVENLLSKFSQEGDLAAGQSEGTRWYDRSKQLSQTELFQPSRVVTGVVTGGSNVQSQKREGTVVIGQSDVEKFLLRSILLSDHGRFANLNSKIVQEGEVVWVDFRESTIVPLSKPEDESTWIRVKVIRIDKDQVELEIGESQRLTVSSRSVL